MLNLSHAFPASSSPVSTMDSSYSSSGSGDGESIRHRSTPHVRFSAWTWFRTVFVGCSPTLLRHRLASEPRRTAKENASIAEILLKTLTVVGAASVRKGGNVNAKVTRDEQWMRDNIQPISRMFAALTHEQGYADKPENSVKRCLYQSAARSIKHLKALDDDRRCVARALALDSEDSVRL